MRLSWRYNALDLGVAKVARRGAAPAPHGGFAHYQNDNSPMRFTAVFTARLMIRSAVVAAKTENGGITKANGTLLKTSPCGCLFWREGKACVSLQHAAM
ncbi:MAG: hypothetical protein RR423_02920 [Hydrogenoanaerobacterium sp.]